MNYKLCELYNKYILSKYEQNTRFIQINPCLRCSFHCFEMLQVHENEISLRDSSGCPMYLRTVDLTLLTIADDAMQMDVHKTFYPFYTTKKMPHVTVTITKKASLAAIARYISFTIIYTVGYLQIFNAGHFFSSKHCHDL